MRAGNFALGLVFLIIAGPLLAADIYTIRLQDENPTEAAVQLLLNEPLNEETVFKARSVAGVTSRITRVVCDLPTEAPATRLQDDAWQLPSGCVRLSWSTSFIEAGDRLYELSKQESLYHPKGWWFINESDALLRYGSQRLANVCALAPGDEKCEVLSSLERPPTFLLVGQSARELDGNKTKVEVFTGFDDSYLGLDNMLRSFSTALEKLNTMTAAVRETDVAPTRLQFAWLSISADLGSIGGAAGNGAFVSNFLIREDNVVEEIEKTRLLIVSLHEYMHMLGVNAGAPWATESLASYYGFKAVAAADHAADVFAQLSYADHRDAPLFLRGAALWKELDDQIGRASDGMKSLDGFLSLLIEPFENDRVLPTKFACEVAALIGKPEYENIVSAYLQGSRPGQSGSRSGMQVALCEKLGIEKP